MKNGTRHLKRTYTNKNLDIFYEINIYSNNLRFYIIKTEKKLNDIYEIEIKKCMRYRDRTKGGGKGRGT